MTIGYTLDVSTSKPWTLFKLLLRWSGSIWKSVVVELFVWLFLYAFVSVIYRTFLTPSQIETFERFSQFCNENMNYIPLNLMLGFFVSVIINRWILIFDNIGYIDNIALLTAMYVKGRDERSRILRRSVIRHCVLAQALAFRDISMRVRRRFPTVDTLVAAGFMMKHEKKCYDQIRSRYSKYWMPFQWAFAALNDARDKKGIASDVLLERVGEEIKKFRTGLAAMCNYDWVPLPVAYPQLVVLAVHTYFFICVFARQHITSENASNKTQVDLKIPFVSIAQFVFYVGWVKVAEAMLNPLGEDDDDFECNFLLDKNLSIGLTVVDEGYHNPPAIEEDSFSSGLKDPLCTVLFKHEGNSQPGITGSVANVRLAENVDYITMLPLRCFGNEDKHYGFSSAANGQQQAAPRRVSVAVGSTYRRGSIYVADSLFGRFKRTFSVSGPSFRRFSISKTVDSLNEPAELDEIPPIATIEQEFSSASGLLDAICLDSDAFTPELAIHSADRDAEAGEATTAPSTSTMKTAQAEVPETGERSNAHRTLSQKRRAVRHYRLPRGPKGSRTDRLVLKRRAHAPVLRTLHTDRRQSHHSNTKTEPLKGSDCSCGGNGSE